LFYGVHEIGGERGRHLFFEPAGDEIDGGSHAIPGFDGKD
jgi:hypothetical protein